MLKNYIIEGDIDFYAELYSSLDNKDTQNQLDETNNNVCLITDESLEANSVTLLCNHKFNYGIFRESQTSPFMRCWSF